MHSVMLILAMSAGQGPAGTTPTAPGYYPALPATRPVGGVAALPDVIQLPSAPQPAMPPMQSQPTPPGMGDGKNNGGDEKKDEEKKDEEKKDEGPPIYLLGQTLRETWLGKKMADDGYRLYGWTAMSYTLGTTSNSNAPMFFNDRPNHFQLNQNWLHFEKSIDTSKSELQWGFVTDSIIPGTDARTTIVRGLFDQQLTQGPLSPNGAVPPSPVGNSVPYPFDLYQFYSQVFMPNLGPMGTTVKIGRFATHCEYELVQAPDTPFVSKSYLFEYNPFTHTGLWATSQLNDTWTVSNGVVVGNDNFIDTTDRFTYIGQLKWAPPKGKSNALFNVVITDPKYNVSEAFPRYNVYNFQFFHSFNDKLSYQLDSAFSHMYNVPGVGAATWYGAANYFFYKISKTVTTTLRAEVFEDTDGIRTGFKGLYTEGTLGLAWNPVQALIIRPSVRYDYNGPSRPFEGDHGMWTAAFEMIFRW
ncbi:MAG TPA: outer membrane beta-barrel protein [Gemmata sp.]|nr:outer membrane beta-barrel protein [Gemmata sp.]